VVLFTRARAAWLLSRLSQLKFTREDVLQQCLNLLIKAVLTKEEVLPVKVEASFAIEAFIQDQHRTHVFIQPQICALTVELLQILRSTENDDLTNVLQKIVCAFVDDIAPIAYDICAHLASTFGELMESAGDVDSKFLN
jgi:methyl coenzyme M reductase subunit D